MKRIEHAQFTFVEVADLDHHPPYNSWHQLTYEPELALIKPVVRTDRWVVSPDCRDYSTVRDGRFADVQYVEAVLIDRDLDDFEIALDSLESRMDKVAHPRFDAVTFTSATYSLTDIEVAPRVKVSPHAMPHRPHLGVFIVVERSVRKHSSLMEMPGVTGVAHFAPMPDADEAGFVSVYWLDEDPIDLALPMIKELRAQGEATNDVLYATAAETIFPWEWDWFE